MLALFPGRLNEPTDNIGATDGDQTAVEQSLLPAAFLDRDGAINRHVGYIGSITQFQFLPGVKRACRLLLIHGYRIIVVTNQGGIDASGRA